MSIVTVGEHDSYYKSFRIDITAEKLTETSSAEHGRGRLGLESTMRSRGRPKKVANR